MSDDNPEKKNGKFLEMIVAIALVTITVIAVVYLSYPTLFPNSQNDIDSGYTKFYTNISATEAFNLMNTTTNLSIIDVRGLEGCGKCQFKNDGHLSGAVLNSNPDSLVNETFDILVYSKNGSVGAGFCEDLINLLVKVKVYNLDGGFEAWIDAGYELEYGSGS